MARRYLNKNVFCEYASLFFPSKHVFCAHANFFFCPNRHLWMTGESLCCFIRFFNGSNNKYMHAQGLVLFILFYFILLQQFRFFLKNAYN